MFNIENYNETEKEIFKRVIIDFDILNRDIKERIDNGYDMDNLYDYLRHLSAVDFTNVDLNDSDFKYIDFNYCDMCISVVQHNEERPYLSESLEIWNDIENYIICDSVDLKDLKAAI